VLLQLNIAAMLGHSGAIFKQVFGSGGGLITSLVILLIWTIFPFVVSLIKFNKKDL
jgi:Cu-processing system permease protein